MDEKQPEQSFMRKANALSNYGPKVVHSSGSESGIKHTAALARTAAMFDVFNNQSDIPRTPLMYIDPLFDPVLLMFPKENLKELNRRLRHYCDYNPTVGNVIELNSTFPYSDAEVRCEVKALEGYFRDYAERLELSTDMVPQMAKDFNALGESIHYGTYDQDTNEWAGFIQLPPENIDIRQNWISPKDRIYLLKADEDLRKAMSSGKPEDQALIEALPEEMKQSLETGQPWRMDSACVIHFAHKTEGYILRGSSPLRRILRWLLMEDKLYMALLTMVDRSMFPIKLWMIGSKEQRWIPTRKHYELLANKLMQIKNDPDADLIYHAFLDMKIINLSANHEDVLKYLSFCEEKELIGLMASKSMYSEANPYAKDSANIKMIMHRFMVERDKINRILQRKVFMTTSIKRGYVLRKRAEVNSGVSEDKYDIPEIKKYIVPKVFWRPSNLVSSMAEREYLLKLRDKKDLPAKHVLENLGYDADETLAALKQEEGTNFDPVFKDARAELIKDPATRNDILRGKRTAELNLPLAPTSGGKGGKSAPDLLAGLSGIPPAPAGLPSTSKPGRPAIPPDQKSRQPAIVSETSMSAREKLNEKDILPQPKGAEEPPI